MNTRFLKDALGCDTPAPAEIRKSLVRQYLAPCGEVAERLKAAAAKRKSASRTSSSFLVNPSVSISSQIKRVGCCWLVL
jgi:hypothetical protein